MLELRYAYRDADDAAALRAAVRRAGLKAYDVAGPDGLTRLVVDGAGDRERLRELIRSARAPTQQRHSVLFEDEVSGGA